jgi:hypothetical protein
VPELSKEDVLKFLGYGAYEEGNKALLDACLYELEKEQCKRVNRQLEFEFPVNNIDICNRHGAPRIFCGCIQMKMVQ